jgi:hypothetical protein
MRYTYEITSVDEQARVMEVVYTHETHGSVLVGVRLPFEGEDLELLIRSYSPAQNWRELEATVVPPAIGLSGEIDDTPQFSTDHNEVVL